MQYIVKQPPKEKELLKLKGWKFALKPLQKLSYSAREASQFLVLFTIVLAATRHCLPMVML